MGRYLDDRPLPDDFSQGGPAWQLATLAWSYHVEDDPAVSQALSHGALEESVHALVDALTVDVPLPATSLSDRYPPLADYRRFLAGAREGDDGTHGLSCGLAVVRAGGRGIPSGMLGWARDHGDGRIDETLGGRMSERPERSRRRRRPAMLLTALSMAALGVVCVFRGAPAARR